MFIQLVLLISLILENLTFREGSDNDRPRQHQDINQYLIKQKPRGELAGEQELTQGLHRRGR